MPSLSSPTFLFNFLFPFSRVSLPLVFRRLLDVWDPALQFLAHKWRTQQGLPFLTIILKAIIKRLAHDEGDNNSQQQTSDSSINWKKDLLREWALHLLKNHSTILFKEEPKYQHQHQHDSAETTSVPSSKKRSHSSMQNDASTNAHSNVDELMYACLKSLNPWLAPLVPLILPYFKLAHNGASGKRRQAIMKMELLLHITMKSLYPNHPIKLPNQMKLDPTPAVSDGEIQSFIHQHQPSTMASITGADTNANTTNVNSAIEAVKDFPFLPIGMSTNGDEMNLWIEDEGW